MSPVQRRIARYLTSHLTEAVFLSSVELAERAGVSQPSVTRFAMVLGFAGYPELRQALRPLALGGEEATGPAAQPAHGEARHCAGVEAELRNLSAVHERLCAEEGDGLGKRIGDLGGALAAGEPLPVLGLRASAGLATTFCHYARRVHPDVRMLTHGGSELAEGLHSARRAGAEWVLAVMLPRYPAEAVRALAYGDRLGLRIAAITDRPAVPFPAEVVLDAPVADRSAAGSHAAPMALAMALVEAMAEAAPLRTGARLSELDRMAEETGEFFVD
ncbi:MurR/RpiR family transcriptional regulator [Spongiactinospora gelatinilytica]|uniref:MurR/RpiR family transcriptional regulator n=1 Tax=Spongiactinospora gelatinilytica TaxID=2666298 RepID=A0A2W2I0I4_9ACTN|nr:MurR/RpiR family transcriptional regulator [Spongiactinospora gelatinilytica]PZG55508.1 MurR/RpiR family transcriptional regulator [Spongiactinospora gelatinilytica]